MYTWLRGLGEYNETNVIFIAELRDDFFRFSPRSLADKYEF